MADPLMGWDERQKRWRVTYKGVPLQIRATALGGTTRTDTVVEANRWFRQKQAQIDRQLAVETLRPHEAAYLDELDSIQTQIKPLLALMQSPAYRSMLAPIVAAMKRKEVLIKQTLLKPTLPPLDDSMRSPLNISLQHLEEEAIQEAKPQIANQIRQQNLHRLSQEDLLTSEEYLHFVEQNPIEPDGTDDVFPSKPTHFDMFIDQHFDIAMRIHEERALKEAGQVLTLPNELIKRKKEELGAIDEYDRGSISQMLKDEGVTITENKLLEYHINKFIEYQQRRHKEGKISAGRFSKICCTIDFYCKWSSIISVTKIGTKDHIDAYYYFLSDKVINKELKPRYAKNLFTDFKMLINWLVDEGVFTSLPACLQRRGDKYTIKVPRQKPEVVDLKLVHLILNAANPRLKLFILLTLNCGLGASEIGHLTRDEYNPKTGRITHKRHKTQEHEKVPTVCYLLWTETRTLLDQTIAERKKYPKHPESAKCLLVNNNGYPLWSESVGDDGESSKSDNITNSFKRLMTKLRKIHPDLPKVTYYQFRKTGATLIGNERKFRGLDSLWLGHAPNTMAGQSYVANDENALDECIEWLHGKIFGTKSPLENKKC